MLRFARVRTLVLPLIIVIALGGLVVGMIRTRPEGPTRMAPAPVDSRIPKQLSTATFGLG